MTTNTADVTDLLADRFPGHTMQRLRTKDGKYRYLYVSSGVESSFGLDPKALMELETVDHAWIHPDDRGPFLEELERSSRDLTPLDTEVRVRTPDGGFRWVRSLGHPRRQPDGATIWDGVALDVTDRREALEALERALAEARRSEVTEGRFSYIAAKDLAQPLADLRAAVGRLTTTGGATPEVSDLAAKFAAFERALDATRGLVTSGTAQGDHETLPDVSDLTERQSEVMSLVRNGASNRAIGEVLGISEGTVKLHVSAAMKKLGVRNRTEAARIISK